MPTKDRVLIILLCLNVVLITAVVINYTHLPQAQAQTFTASSAGNYILITGDLRFDHQILWIIDPVNRQLAGCVYDPSRRVIRFGGVISLVQPAGPTLP